MTDCGYEKNLDKMKPGELKREIGDLQKRLNAKDAEISQLQDTVRGLMESGSEFDEIMEMRKKASDALKNALEEADSIIKEARAAADKIIEHARLTKECIAKGLEEPELVLPGSLDLIITDDLLKTNSVKKECAVKPGSSFAEYFTEKEAPAEPETVEEAEPCCVETKHVFEEYVTPHEISLPPIVAAPTALVPCQSVNRHVFEEYVEKHNVVLPPRAADVPVVQPEQACGCGGTKHVFEEYVPRLHNIVLPPRTAAGVSAPAKESLSGVHHVFEDYISAKKEETFVPAEKKVSAADGWRELVDSLHK